MKRIVAIVLSIIFFIAINNLGNSIYNLWQKQSVVDQAESELTREKTHNSELKKQLSQVEQPAFVEEEARNKLLMVKSGEKLVLLPSKPVEPTPQVQQKEEQTKPTWELWKELFAL